MCAEQWCDALFNALAEQHRDDLGESNRPQKSFLLNLIDFKREKSTKF